MENKGEEISKHDGINFASIDTKPIISKRQMKKIKNKELWESTKDIRKKYQKEKDREKRKKKNELINKTNDEMEKEKVMKEPKTVWEEKFRQKIENGIKICIDCDFENLMTEKEIISLCRQVTEIYSRNRKSSNPFSIILVDLGEKLYNNLKKNGFEQWIGFKYLLKNNENKFITEHKDKIIYLSGDSENTLDKLDKDNIYIIGGIVDRNRHKLITLNKANDLKINHAKLPLEDYIDLKSSKVLTTNHVFDILSYYQSVKQDWKESFLSIIPKRKIEK